MNMSVHPDADNTALADGPAAVAGSSAEPAATRPFGTRIRSRLFTKYVALFVAVVAIALLSNGIFEVFFYYREHKAALIRIQHEQAEAAAAKISQFVKEIESQLGWTTQLPWSAGSIEQHQFDARRLLRQVPAVTELAQIDATGKERLKVSRLAMDVVDSGLDLSKDAKFTEAVAHKVYYGPVYFRRESEPYMTLSLAGTRKDAGVSIAEVNLKLIWDVVSQIKVGEHGHAYVVGAAGRLIAHPDISLVLRNTDMSKLVQVQAAQAGKSDADSELLQGAKNIQGQEVLTASAPITPLGWTMFVELPVEEAYASLYAALQRLALVLGAASLFAVLAGIFLARRMVGPIQALRAGAERIGGGDFAQRISIRTGDELEGLANQFNDMGARLQESYADLENKVEQRTVELSETLQHQTATSEVLKVISRSPGDLGPVFETILASATGICDAQFGNLFILQENGGLRCDSVFNLPPAFAEAFSRNPVIYPPPIDPLGRLVATCQPVHVVDVRQEPAYLTSFPPIVDLVELGGARTVLLVPMLKEDKLVGVIAIFRQAVQAFSDKQVDLVRSFASQAVIAIENARLLTELRARTDDLSESLQQQTATADVLKVISRSAFDLKSVLTTLTESAQSLCGASLGIICLRDGEVMRLQAESGCTQAFIDFMHAHPIRPGRETMTGRVFMDGKSVHVPDVQLDAEYNFGNAPTIGEYRAVIAVPLMRDRTVEGVLLLGRPAPGPFSERQIELVQTFADQAVIAIENTRLFNETKEALERQTATADILKVIASSPSNVQPVFEAIATRANSLVGGFSSTVFRLIDGVAHLMAFTPTTPEADEILTSTFPRSADSFAPFRMARDGEVAQVTDTETLTDEILDIARARGFRSMLFAPLMNKGASIGLIVVTRLQPGAFSDHHVQLLRTFADQAVIAIENVRLFDEVQARTRELSSSLEELRAAQDRLVQTEKLASLGQLTAGIAHEIKNPLNFVNNFSALSTELIDELNDLLKANAIDGKAREDIDEITRMLKGNLEKVVQHGKRADSIVKNMLLHSREGSGELRQADINAIVEESLNLAYHGARAEKPGFNITLTRDLDPAAGVIELYPQEITRVFLNLISNGFYAAAKRREAGEAGFEPTLKAATKNLGKEVEIRIRDNGTGIPAELREKIFNPFFTTKPAGEGTGLGLSMSHDIIVKQHGGKIDVDTAPGAFTEFVITLPRVAAAKTYAGGRN
jgi:signal transduction histidine kinase